MLYANKPIILIQMIQEFVELLKIECLINQNKCIIDSSINYIIALLHFIVVKRYKVCKIHYGVFDNE